MQNKAALHSGVSAPSRATLIEGIVTADGVVLPLVVLELVNRRGSLWVSLVSDQMPCFLGKPGCD